MFFKAAHPRNPPQVLKKSIQIVPKPIKIKKAAPQHLQNNTERGIFSRHWYDSFTNLRAYFEEKPDRQRTRWTATSQARRECPRRGASETTAQRRSLRACVPRVEATPFPRPLQAKRESRSNSMSAAAAWADARVDRPEPPGAVSHRHMRRPEWSDRAPLLTLIAAGPTGR